MMAPGSAIDVRVLSAVDAEPSRIPVILGGDGTGRSTILRRLRDGLGADRAQYVDLERTLTTPERLLGELLSGTRFEWSRDEPADSTPGAAFESVLRFLTTARPPRGGPAVFLLDEILELRMLDSFPGLRGITSRALDVLAHSANRFVFSTRHVSRALRLLRDASDRYLVLHAPPVAEVEVAEAITALDGVRPSDALDFARAAVLLADGRQAYVSAIVQQLGADVRGNPDPVAALAELMSGGGALAARCCHSYEMRLHRARGYGALKAILDILSKEEPLTLTEIALRLRRTPGSTKDYLSWLEDVDLVRSHQKRYAITDPLLRLWIRLHCKPEPPSDEAVAREVQRYAASRLPAAEPVAVEQPVRTRDIRDRQRNSGIIEID
jgi:hypothetical protein